MSKGAFKIGLVNKFTLI